MVDNKKTKAEIDAELQELNADEDKEIEKEEDLGDDVDDSQDEEVEDAEDVEDKDEPADDVEVEKKEVKKEEDKPEDTDTEDYKKKFVESSKEALLIRERNKNFSEAVAEAEAIPEPTDEDLKKAYPDQDFDMLSSLEKTLLKDNYINKKKMEKIYNVVEKTKKTDEWIEKVNNFVEDDAILAKYQKLQGREAEFVKYANKPGHVGIDVEIIAKAFIGEIGSQPAPKGGSLFETRGGGKAPEKKALDENDAKMYRTQPKLYRQMIKNKKIVIDL